ASGRRRAGRRRDPALPRRAAGGLRTALAAAAGAGPVAAARAELPADRLRAPGRRRVSPAPARAGRQAAALPRRPVPDAAARGRRMVGLFAGLRPQPGPRT